MIKQREQQELNEKTYYMGGDVLFNFAEKLKEVNTLLESELASGIFVRDAGGGVLSTLAHSSPARDELGKLEINEQL